MWTDRRIDKTKLMVALRNFSTAPKIDLCIWEIKYEGEKLSVSSVFFIGTTLSVLNAAVV
jgi:hypothetical protein